MARFTLLKFFYGNAKLSRQVAHFSLPSGFSCPFAKACLAKADRHTGRITDGPEQEFRCYSAMMESTFTRLRDARWFNWEALRACKGRKEMATLLHMNMQFVDAEIIRLHIGGEFYSQTYFDAWMDVARKNPQKLFYSYTKALPYWVKRLRTIPKNMKLIASKGGTHDHLIAKHNLRCAEVVYSVEEAEQKGLEIDHTDEIAYKTKKSFSLLIHGINKAGTMASKAVSALRLIGLGGYSRERQTSYRATA